MLSLTSDFPGGNILVDSIDGATVLLRQDRRDCSEWWFHWSFPIRGAAGRTLRFLFDDESFEVVNDHAVGKGKRSTFRYAALLRTVEDKDAFYLFIRKGQAFIVGKSDFAVGSADELGSRLRALGSGVKTKRRWDQKLKR